MLFLQCAQAPMDARWTGISRQLRRVPGARLRRVATILLAGLILTAPSLGQQSEKPDISGKWSLDVLKSKLTEPVTSRVLEIQKHDKEFRVSETVTRSGTEALLEYQCGITGKECDMKDEGHPAKVALYYNGPILVEMKTNGREGDNVTRRRYELKPEGTLTVEITHIDPPKETQTLVYTRPSK